MISIIALIYIAIMLYFYNSQDKVKQKIGKGMLIVFGILAVLPVVAGILIFVTCLGVI